MHLNAWLHMRSGPPPNLVALNPPKPFAALHSGSLNLGFMGKVIAL